MEHPTYQYNIEGGGGGVTTWRMEDLTDPSMLLCAGSVLYWSSFFS